MAHKKAKHAYTQDNEYQPKLITPPLILIVTLLKHGSRRRSGSNLPLKLIKLIKPELS